jgi:hypothetical protein
MQAGQTGPYCYGDALPKEEDVSIVMCFRPDNILRKFEKKKKQNPW